MYTKPDSVYLLESKKRSEFKIGMSSNPQRRANELSTTTLLKVRCSKKVSDPSYCEFKLHKIFSKYKVRGEWFHFPADVIKTVIYSIRNVESLPFKA